MSKENNSKESVNSALRKADVIRSSKKECVICENCKSYWIRPIDKCDCGCKSFAPTHDYNIQFGKEFRITCRV